jgi:hypothetical protein
VSIKYFFKVSFLIILFSPPQKFAQNYNEPFSALSISADYIYNSENYDLNQYYRTKNGFDISAQTQFYFGKIQIGNSLSFSEGYMKQQPEYLSNFLYLGWGEDLFLHERIGIYLGIKFGPTFMIFEDPELNKYKRTESEIALGTNAKIKLKLINNLYLNSTLEFIKLFTEINIRKLYYLIGISYNFEMPSWISSAID